MNTLASGTAGGAKLNSRDIGSGSPNRVMKNDIVLLNQIWRLGDNQTWHGGSGDFFHHPANAKELQYFSEFHKFWDKHHREVLNMRIDRPQARKAASALRDAVARYGPSLLSVTHDTHNLTPEAIAQARFFAANQDFRWPPERQFERYLEDPTRFEAQYISENADDFLRFLGVTRLSQTDKRLDFARNAARFLLQHEIRAFELAGINGNDAAAIRGALVSTPNMGYGLKKANMFVRDMIELGVWPSLRGLDQLDVSSDINTMKLALRTGILKTDIPLLSSFLDIFGYQYSHTDQMSAQAWRVVWEEWRDLDVSTVPDSPCRLDFLLYRIGRDYCDDDVVEYTCGRGHTFYHFGARVRNCRVCQQSTARSSAIPGRRWLPCQLHPANLPRERGQLLLSGNNLLVKFNGLCILETVCAPKSPGFHSLDPPKSISVKGQTSWTESYSYRERGGGGMMG